MQTNYRLKMATAAAALVLATGGCGGSSDGDSTGSAGEAPAAPAEPVPPPLAQEEPADPGPGHDIGQDRGNTAAPCPQDWPVPSTYGGVGTPLYPLDVDATEFFSGFDLCTSPGGYAVLINNTDQVWSFAPDISLRTVARPDTVAELFHEGFDEEYTYAFAVPGDVVQPSVWPDQIAWGPDPALTSAWTAQSIALDHLDIDAEAGELQDQVTQYIKMRQLKTSNPAGAALLTCAKTAFKVEKDVTGPGSTDDAIDRLKVALGATTGGASCARSIRELAKDPAAASKDWTKSVERVASTASKGVDAAEAITPALKFCSSIHVQKLAFIHFICP